MEDQDNESVMPEVVTDNWGADGGPIPIVIASAKEVERMKKEKSSMTVMVKNLLNLNMAFLRRF